MALLYWRAIHSVATFVAVLGLAPVTTGQTTNKASEIVWMRGGHSDGVLALAYSPDGNLLASGSEDWTLKLWRVADGRLIRSLVPNTAPVRTLRFSPDGRFLAVGTEANEHDRTEFQVLETEHFSNVLTNVIGGAVGIAFSPNGDLMAIHNEGVRVFRTVDWRLQWELQTSSDGVSGIAFSPDGTRLAVAESDDRNRLTLRDAASGDLLWSTNPPIEWIGAVAYSPRGDEILCGGDEFVEVRSVTDGSLLRTLNAPHLRAMDFAPDGASLATCSRLGSPSTRVWDWPSGNLRYALPEIYSYAAATFSPDGQSLVTGSSYWGGNGISIWRSSDGQPLARVDEHRAIIEKLVFSPDSTLLASGGFDQSIRLWRVADGQRVAVIHRADSIKALAFSPDASLIVAGGAYEVVGLWSTNGTLVRNLNHPLRAVGDAAFSPDGRFVAVLFNANWQLPREVVIFDVASGNSVANGPSPESFRLGRNGIVSPDGRFTAEFTYDPASSIKSVWMSGRRLESFHGGAPAMAFAADSGTLLVAGTHDPVLKFWGTTSFEVADTYTNEVAGGAPWFTRDGNDRIIGRWDGATVVAYSADRQFFAYGRVDGTVVLARNQYRAPVRMFARAEGGGIRMSWSGGNRYYAIEERDDLQSDHWRFVLSTTATNEFRIPQKPRTFYRVKNLGN